MSNKTLVALFIMVSFGFIIIITVPILTLSIELSTYEVMDVTDDSYIYNPTNASPIEKLNVYVEYGDIEIEYVSSLVSYFAMIELNIEMSGDGLANKDFTDFFEVEWDDTSPSPSFRIKFNSNVDKLAVLPLINNLTILVNLRSGIIFDLNITLEEGNTDLLIPFRVPINNIVVNVSKGDIFYEFNYCTIEGNITGRVNEGNIELKILNSRYTSNSYWNFTINNGDIKLNITYNKDLIDLGANVTCMTILNDGRALFIYKDENDHIGARFEIPFENNTVRSFFPDCLLGSFQNCKLDGFDYNEPDLPYTGFPAEGSVIFTSFDLLEKRVMNYYDLLFIINQGDFFMDLTSIN